MKFLPSLCENGFNKSDSSISFSIIFHISIFPKATLLYSYELFPRGYEIQVGVTSNSEIDFIATKDGQKEYYQVAYILHDENTIKREFGVYQKVKDNFPKYVISADHFDFSQDGIIRYKQHFLALLQCQILMNEDLQNQCQQDNIFLMWTKFSCQKYHIFCFNYYTKTAMMSTCMVISNENKLIGI